jgi:hypothetical protein
LTQKELGDAQHVVVCSCSEFTCKIQENFEKSMGKPRRVFVFMNLTDRNEMRRVEVGSIWRRESIIDAVLRVNNPGHGFEAFKV